MNRNTAVALFIVAALIIVGLIKGGRPGSNGYHTRTDDEEVKVDELPRGLVQQLRPTTRPSDTQPGEGAIHKSYTSRKAMIDAATAAQSSGGAIVIFSDTEQEDQSVLTGFAIEVLPVDKTRYVVFREQDGKLLLVDDFEGEGNLAVNRVSELHGQLVFFTAEGKTPLIRTPVK